MGDDSTIPTSHTLIERVRRRDDPEAWARFDSIYRPLMREYATLRKLRPDAIEDVVQAGMLQVLKHIQRFDYRPERGGFRAYLRTIIRNLVFTRLRDEKRAAAGGDLIARLPAEEESPDEVFDLLWQREHLNAALQLLQRDVSATNYRVFCELMLLGRRAEDVAADFGMTENNVYKIKFRLLRRLRDKLIDLLGDDAASVMGFE